MKLKIAYRVRNWKQYNQALRNRGDITIWFTEEALTAPVQKGKRGRPVKYPVAFIRLALAVRYFLRLPLRATQGFMDGLMKQQGFEHLCCDYTLLSKRAAEVEAEMERLSKEISYVAHVVIDSTGLKVYGEGEWKTRQHGVSKRRTWRKLHLAINSETHEIVGHVLTGKNVSDGSALPRVVRNVKKIGKASLMEPMINIVVTRPFLRKEELRLSLQEKGLILIESSKIRLNPYVCSMCKGVPS